MFWFIGNTNAGRPATPLPLMSGLGFENGGLSLAHSLTRGLVKARGAKNAIHGQHVAWGALVQLAAENREQDLLSLLEFNREISLATCLADLGMANPTEPEISDIAHWTMTAPHLANLSINIDVLGVIKAIHDVEQIGVRHV